MLTGMETFRNVLLVALLIGFAYVLMRRMAYAMRKHEVQPGMVDLQGAGVEVVGGKLIVHADIQGGGVPTLCVKVTHHAEEHILHDGPVGGGEVDWAWSVPEHLQGETVEVHLTAPKSRVLRRVQLS